MCGGLYPKCPWHCRCCGRELELEDGPRNLQFRIHPKCRERHWQKHAFGQEAKHCEEYR